MTSRPFAAKVRGAGHLFSSASVGAWTVICATLIAVRVLPEFLPRLANDSFQYLSMAQNALQGDIAYSSIVHFDAERSFGVIPAPVVTFPTGYPLVVALVSRLGLQLETAALLISALSMIACVPILAWLANRLGVSAPVRNVLVGAFSINALVTKYGGSALTEGLFTLLILVGAALLVSGLLRSARGGYWLWLAAGLAFGASYLVRYAGLFFVVGLAALCVRHLLARDRPVARGYAVALAVAAVPVLIGTARNLALVGNWQGGNEKAVSHAVTGVLTDTAVAINGIFVYGPGVTSDSVTFMARALGLGLFYLGVLLITWSYFRYRSVLSTPELTVRNVAIDLLMLTLVYGGCMFYAALTTPINYGVRMLMPLSPLLLLLLGITLDRMLRAVPRTNFIRRVSLLLLLASIVPYAFLNLSGLREPPPLDVSAVAAAFDASGSDSMSPRAIIAEIAGHDGAIVANNGLAVGYVLQRRTVSLVGPEFSEAVWNEATLRAIVQRFQASAVVISRGIPTGQGPNVLEDDLPSRLVAELASGTSPSWLKLVYRSREVLIYVPEASP